MPIDDTTLTRSDGWFVLILDLNDSLGFIFDRGVFFQMISLAWNERICWYHLKEYTAKSHPISMKML